ncbi:MAG: patatin-like phospholipase family protein [Ectothiorhodospiraceae bacterium]|nr:patatin-like phospholipase family protein [Ectothiorhodospiraceae bacterium]
MQTIQRQPKLGLVLAGGGAKGAYQAGVLQYLCEIGFEPNIIAGTSIGALNGAVLSTSSDFAQGVNRVDKLWDKLGRSNVIRLNSGADCLLDPRPIESFLREAVMPLQLRNGIELWVTAFPALRRTILPVDYKLLMTAIDLFRARMGTNAHWLRVQDCNDDETLYSLLLASAAIPIAFPHRVVNGQVYVDGALADNVPLGALAARGVTHAIVIHLGNGAIWDRSNFPDLTVIEIRPVDPVNELKSLIIGNVTALLDFSFERIILLKERGYQDAKCHLEKILEGLLTVRKQRHAHDSLQKNTKRVLDDEAL